MFKKAKIKLTLWYLLIIMTVSLFLSLIIYIGVSSITDRALRMQMDRMERKWDRASQGYIHKPIFEHETLVEIKRNMQVSLVRINVSILVISAVAGYFLASKTLKPIEEMVEEQKRFISDASHELKTPITALKTELEVSLKDKKQDKKKLFGLLKSNLEEVNKLQKLTESLLKESKYQKEVFSKNTEIVDLKKLVEDTAINFEKQADRKGILIVKNLKKAGIRGEKDSLKELCSILIDNAIKFSKKGQEVAVKLYTDKKHVYFVVKDRGVGIKKGDNLHIFG